MTSPGPHLPPPQASGPALGPPLVSVVVVSWNTRDRLARCLRHVQCSASAERLEIIAVDNNSTDGSAELVGSEFEQVLLIRNGENRGYAAACNQGLRRARGEFVCLLNSDCYVEAGTISGLSDFLAAHPAAAGAAPALLNADGELENSVSEFPRPFLLWLGATVPGSLRVYSAITRNRPSRRLPACRHEVEVDQPMTSCMVFRRSSLMEVGGFDESFPLFYNDVDLCLRLRQRGLQIWYVPRLAAIHDHGASTRQFSATLHENHAARLLYFRRHLMSGRIGSALAFAMMQVVHWFRFHALRRRALEGWLP